jgi:hypothetical protein
MPPVAGFFVMPPYRPQAAGVACDQRRLRALLAGRGDGARDGGAERDDGAERDGAAPRGGGW